MQPDPPSESRVKEAILSVVGARWMKVAMVLAKTADAVGLGLPSEDELWEVIAARVEALVKDGCLEAQGNLKNWRGSEVRRVDEEALANGE
jgi:hypothetical protein